MKDGIIKKHYGKLTILILIVYTWFGVLVGNYFNMFDAENKIPTAVGVAYIITWFLIALYLIFWVITLSDD
jgi:hypothetical protein